MLFCEAHFVLRFKEDTKFLCTHSCVQGGAVLKMMLQLFIGVIIKARLVVVNCAEDAKLDCEQANSQTVRLAIAWESVPLR